MTRRVWTAEEVWALGVRTDLETAASVWGLSRTKAYELVGRGEFPSPVLRVGNKWVVLVTPMMQALGITHPSGEVPPAQAGAQEPGSAPGEHRVA